MPTFGFSAYLKLSASNERPQRSIIRTRLSPVRSEGYDFHRSLRLRTRRLMTGSHSIAEVLESLPEITKQPERESVRRGVQNLIEWRDSNPSEIFEVAPATYESPNGIFKVNYTPDFGVRVGGRKTAIHIWNTKTPELSRRIVYSALAIFSDHYRNTSSSSLDDIAVLSLRDGTLYPLDLNAEASFLGRVMVARIEAQFDRVREELQGPAPDGQPAPRPPFSS